MAENQTMSSWDRIRQGVADVENLMDQKQYNLSMVRGRQTLEYMINYLAQSVRLQPSDMCSAIDELYNLNVISAQSRENYHNIRLLGNAAAHEGNNSSSDAASAYQMLSREVYAFADSYAKTARRIGQMIKNGQSVPTRNASGSSGSAGSAGSARTARTSGTAQSSARNGYTINTEPEIGLSNTRRAGSSYQGSNYQGTRSSSVSGTRSTASAGTRSSGYQGNAGSSSGTRGSYASGTRNSAASTRSSSASGARNSAYSARSSSARTSGARKSNRSSAMIAGVSPEVILKIMIPIILVILLIAVIKFVTNKSSSGDAETSAVGVTESVSETMQVVTAAPIPVETTQAQTEPETTQAAVYRYTTTDSLKVRTAPGTDAGVVDVLQPGTEVTYIEQVDDKWSKISYNGSEAYVATEYLKKEQVQ